MKVDHFPKDIVPKLESKLNGPALMIPCKYGTKIPIKKWGGLSLDSMNDPNHLQSLIGANIGVALGEVSKGLCSIDLDSDEMFQEFKRENPGLGTTFETRGKRGGNIWIRFEGPYPQKTVKLLSRKGEALGEFRSTGAQTIVWGRHPAGMNYKNNNGKVMVVPYSMIKWPESIVSFPRLELEVDLVQRDRKTERLSDGGTEGTEGTEVVSLAGVCSEQFRISTVEEAVALCLPTTPQQNNACLFKLARALLNLWHITGRKITPEIRRKCFSIWYNKVSEAGFLRSEQSKDDYLVEFLNACAYAKCLLGEDPVARAWEESQAGYPPEADRFENADLKHLISLCYRLQLHHPNGPFFLSARTVQKLFKRDNHAEPARWLRALVQDGILEIAKQGTTKTATRYIYRSISKSPVQANDTV